MAVVGVVVGMCQGVGLVVVGFEEVVACQGVVVLLLRLLLKEVKFTLRLVKFKNKIFGCTNVTK